MADVPHRCQDIIGALGHHRLPCRLTLAPFCAIKTKVVWDAACVDTVTPSHVAATVAKANERRKYLPLNIVAVEILGSWDVETQQTFTEISARLVDFSCDPRASIHFGQGLVRTTKPRRILHPNRRHLPRAPEKLKRNLMQRRRSDKRGGCNQHLISDSLIPVSRENHP
ncbi:hypothetical protein ACJJTC_007072 [Scirpophaga incertulas]